MEAGERNIMKKAILIMAGMLFGGSLCWGLGNDNAIVLNNNLSFSWNDNYYQVETNKTSTGIISESPEVVANLNRGNTYIALRYRPSFSWYTDSAVRNHSVQHELDASLHHFFSQRLSLSANETFRRGINPELLDRNNALVSPDFSFVENTVNGAVGIQLRQATRLDVSGRYYIMRYDEEAVSTNQNYNIATVGLSLRQEMSKATTLSGNLSYDNTSYRQLNARSSSTVSIGAGVDHSFGARLLGSFSGGYQLKDFEASISGQNSPYGNFSFTYLFDPRLRLTAGASYSLWEADLVPYTSQERLTGYFALGYDITPRISFNLSGGVTRGKYNAEQVYTTTVSPTTLGGTDNIYQAGARLSYQVNRHNWLDVSYNHSTGSSDIRSDFDVNTYSAGWRVSY